jgi:predicted RNase H-like nuclease (RuvC/YqgF family)
MQTASKHRIQDLIAQVRVAHAQASFLRTTRLHFQAQAQSGLKSTRYMGQDTPLLVVIAQLKSGLQEATEKIDTLSNELSELQNSSEGVNNGSA